MKILVVGAEGFIGRHIARLLSESGHQATLSGLMPSGPNYLHINVAEPVFALDKFDSVIFCSSPNYQKPAEELEKFLQGALKWIQYFNASSVPLVFLSTNHIFDGKTDRPELTTASSPIDTYGDHKTRLEAEVLRNPRSSIVRLTKVIGAGAPPFTGWLQALSAGQTVQAFGNFMIAPIPVSLVAQTVLRICENKISGIFHLSALDEMSFADVLINIAQTLGLNSNLIEKVQADPNRFPRIGRSPKLGMTETCARLGIQAPTVANSVKDFCATYSAHSRTENMVSP